jgi:hypothetical protein
MAVSPRKRRKRTPRKRRRASAPTWWRKALDTWPKKAAAAVGAAVFASAMSYFLGADFWSGVEKKVGTAGPPVQVTTITDIDRFDSGVVHLPEFVVDRPIGEVPPPPSGNAAEGRFAWGKEIGGVDAFASLIRVVISGKAKAPVLLQSLRIRVVDRRRPLSGTLLSYSGRGQPQSVRYVQVDLAKEPPAWTYIGPEGKPGELFPLRVTESETEVFDIYAFATRGDVYWYLELDYTADGDQGTARIDDDGEPFRTTQSGAPGQRQYAWIHGRWRPLPDPG